MWVFGALLTERWWDKNPMNIYLGCHRGRVILKNPKTHNYTRAHIIWLYTTTTTIKKNNPPNINIIESIHFRVWMIKTQIKKTNKQTKHWLLIGTRIAMFILWLNSLRAKSFNDSIYSKRDIQLIYHSAISRSTIKYECKQTI